MKQTADRVVVRSLRELDALVAEKVMGERRPVFSFGNLALHESITGTGKWSEGGNWVERCEYATGDILDWYPRPFSTDIAAAWTVVEKLQAENWGWMIEFDKGRAEASFGSYSATHRSTPVSICCAALASRGIEVTLEIAEHGEAIRG